MQAGPGIIVARLQYPYFEKRSIITSSFFIKTFIDHSFDPLILAYLFH
jgi:hypothetical protein